MIIPEQSPPQSNRLLANLSIEDRALLTPHLEPVDLPLRHQLERAKRDIEHIYFLDKGIASVVANGDAERSIEIGLVGKEGCTGVASLLGAERAPHETFMQMAGAGQRMTSSAMRTAMDESPSLRKTMLLYAHCFFVQVAQTALANGRSKLEDRLVRWLLMAHDRAFSDEFPITHEFLATMLGVRRPGVTVAINELQRQGLIKASRGAILIRNREAMEASANGAYGLAESEYERLMPAA